MILLNEKLECPTCSVVAHHNLVSFSIRACCMCGTEFSVPHTESKPLYTNEIREEQNMSGVPEAVLVERVANALQRAVVANDAKDAGSARKELESAKMWLDKLREEVR